MGRNIGGNISKNLSSKYSQKLMTILNNLLQMHVKLLQKEQFKKHQKQLVIWLEIKLLIESQKSQKLHDRIVQKRMKKRYLEKYIYLQNKDKKLLMI